MSTAAALLPFLPLSAVLSSLMPSALPRPSRMSDSAGTSLVGILMAPPRPWNALTAVVKLPWIWSLMGCAMPARDGSSAAMSYIMGQSNCIHAAAMGPGSSEDGLNVPNCPAASRPPAGWRHCP